MTIDANLNKKLARIVRKHRRMKMNGVVHRVGGDGLIRSRPRIVAPHVPVYSLTIIVGLLFAFKSLLFAQLGPNNYALKVENLRGGTMLEQAGALIMQPEIVTVTVGGYLKQFVFQS